MYADDHGLTDFYASMVASGSETESMWSGRFWKLQVLRMRSQWQCLKPPELPNADTLGASEQQPPFGFQRHHFAMFLKQMLDSFSLRVRSDCLPFQSVLCGYGFPPM